MDAAGGVVEAVLVPCAVHGRVSGGKEKGHADGRQCPMQRGKVISRDLASRHRQAIVQIVRRRGYKRVAGEMG